MISRQSILGEVWSLVDLTGFSLTIHQRLIIASSIAAVLLTIVGYVSYLYNSWQVVIIAIVGSTCIIMANGFFLYYSITVPVKNMKRAVSEISKGNFDVKVVLDRNKDELAELALNIERMKNELKEKDHMKDEFISIASHELRTPIQPIMSYTDLARRGVVSQEKAWEIITQQARRLKNLADDILDASRIEGRRLTMKKERFYLNEVIQKTIDEKKPALARDVVMQFYPEADIEIYGDKSRIFQVFSNIIGNAVKFTKQGSIHVQTALSNNSSSVQITIGDTGGGIPEDLFPKLFSKFGTRSVGEGAEHSTGLGLFISKAIVEAHDGTIAGLNNEKGGATFRIAIPIVRKQDSVVVDGISQTLKNEL